MTQRLAGLDFPGFARARLDLLAQDPGLVDAANTQLYQALPNIDPRRFTPIQASSDPKSAHRCHVAEAFCQHLGLDEQAWKGRTLVSQGVRDSLGIVMRHARDGGSRVWVPMDVYPVYLDLARQAGVDVQPYPAREGLDLAMLDGQSGWTVLLCDPLKPWGGTISEQYRDRLIAMARQHNGKIVVDGAYAAGLADPWRQAIERDDPVAVLFSVSKGWLLPYRAGAVFACDGFSSSWKSAFAANQCSRDGLRQGYAALKDYPDRPALVAAVVDRSRRDMLEQMAGRGIRLGDPGHGYLVACEHDVDLLLGQGVLAVPASVFGCARGGSVLSSLDWVRPDE